MANVESERAAADAVPPLKKKRSLRSIFRPNRRPSFEEFTVQETEITPGPAESFVKKKRSVTFLRRPTASPASLENRIDLLAEPPAESMNQDFEPVPQLNQLPPLTPTPTPEPKKKRSWFNLRKQDTPPVTPPVHFEPYEEEEVVEEDMWEHHPYYFPQYESFLKVDTSSPPTPAGPGGGMDAMPVTAMPMPSWEPVPTDHKGLQWNNGAKLKKNKVQFTPGPDGNPYLPTPDTTPERPTGKAKGKPKSAMKASPAMFPSGEPIKGMTEMHPLLQRQPAGGDWKHHDSYFPEYTPIWPKKPYTGLANVYGLSEAERQADSHSQTMGHAVSIHYPDLPSWAEYGKTIPKGQTGWQTTKLGTEGWTGYGYDGNKLPNAQGQTFGAPMPPGEQIQGQQGQGGGKKNKKKNKGGGGGQQGGQQGGKQDGGDGDGDGEGDGDGDGEGDGGDGGDGED